MAANNGFDRIIPKRGTLAQIETAIATLVDYEIAIDKDSSVLTYRLGDEIIPMGAGSSTIRTTQATAGILVNDLMAYDGTDFIVADLLAENPVPVKAIVSKLVDTTAIDGTVDGFILLENMLDSSGGALVSNTVYFVDPTNPKKMTATQPTSGWVQPIFQTFLNKGLINGIMLDSPIFNADNRVSTLQVGAGLTLADDVISADLADDPIDKVTPSSVKVVSEKNLADEVNIIDDKLDPINAELDVFNDNLLAVNGYQKLPGGCIMQWGTVTVPNDNVLTVTFPIPFPNNCGSVHTNRQVARAQTPYVASGITNTKFDIARLTTVDGSNEINWFAIGY